MPNKKNPHHPKSRVTVRTRRRFRRKSRINWYSIESYFSRLGDVDTVRELRERMRMMVENDHLWELIELGTELEQKRRSAADAAEKIVSKFRLKK